MAKNRRPFPAAANIIRVRCPTHGHHFYVACSAWNQKLADRQRVPDGSCFKRMIAGESSALCLMCATIAEGWLATLEAADSIGQGSAILKVPSFEAVSRWRR